MADKSLKNQIALCQRRQWMLALALGGIAIVFLLVCYLPVVRKQQSLAQQVESGRRELEASQTRARSLPSLELEVDKLKSRLARFDAKLPRQQDLGQFLHEITQLSQKADLRKVVNQPGVARKADMYQELPISLTFEGGFNQVYAFLRDAEEMQRLTRIRSLQIRSLDWSKGQVDVKLVMSIYYSEG